MLEEVKKMHIGLRLAACSLLIPSFAIAKEKNAWESAAHLGFGIENQSSTGFDDVAGSLTFFDVTYGTDSPMRVGLRTIAQGGKAEVQEFYRMGAGPMLSWQLNKTWLVHLSVARYRETGLHEGDKAYSSAGNSITFGWERCLTISSKIEAAWGGFLSQQRGSIDHLDVAATRASKGAPPPFADAKYNTSLTKGVEIALRLTL